jgi:hypothetical protein
MSSAIVISVHSGREKEKPTRGKPGERLRKGILVFHQSRKGEIVFTLRFELMHLSALLCSDQTKVLGLVLDTNEENNSSRLSYV